MASRVRTLTDLSVPPVEPARQPPRTFLSSHPDMLTPDTSLLQSVLVQGSTGTNFVPTAEGQETRHRPTYPGPNRATRVVLSGIGGLVRGGTSAYVQYATTTQYLHDALNSERPNVVRTDHACPMPEDSNGTTGSSNDASIQGETQDGGSIRNASSEQPTDIDSDPQHQHGITVDVAAETQDHATAASQSETSAIVNDLEVPDQASISRTAQVQGDIEVRIRHEGFDIGSGGHEHARPLGGAAHDRDIGFEMFSPSRSSGFMRVGAAVSHRVTRREPLTDQLCAP
jgi:hypothetical protein